MTGGVRSRRGTPASSSSRDCQCQSLTRQPTQGQVLTSNINSYSLLVMWRNWGFPTLGYMPLVLIQTTLSTILPRHARFPART